MAVSCNADILPLKVVILISLKNYAVNQMRTAGVRIRNGTLSAVQTKISSKTADAPYPLSIITSYCEIPFSTHHSFHMPRMVSQGCTPPLTTCTQPFNFQIGTGGDQSQAEGRPDWRVGSPGAPALHWVAKQGWTHSQLPARPVAGASAAPNGVVIPQLGFLDYQAASTIQLTAMY